MVAREMPKVNPQTRRIALGVSAGIAIAIIALGCLTVGFTAALDDFVFFALVAAITPFAFLNYIEYRWRKAVDEHLPDLFRSIVQAQETGMTLTEALDDAAKRDYGALTPELRKMTIQISWGASFEAALLAFAHHVGTVLTQRTVPMIIEASRSGGKVEQVFDPMGKFIQTTLLLEKERKTQTKPYIAIIYIALLVFLFTIVLLFKTFFTSAEGVPMLLTSATPPDQLERIFLHMTLIQAFFGGLVAGKMGEGSVYAGLKHSLIMMVLGYLSLRLLL
jgi:flagellar protein FlaJ